MKGYILESEPFFVNLDTHVSLFRGISLARNSIPIIAKRHDFPFIQNPKSQESISQCINAALSQAKVQHPHTCDILEVYLTIQQSNCSVFHILEALDGSVGQDIENGRSYTEVGLRKFLAQVSSALAYAHSKVRNT